MPARSYLKILSTYTPLIVLAANEQSRDLIAPYVPPDSELDPGALRSKSRYASIRELAAYYPMDPNILDELDVKLRAIR